MEEKTTDLEVPEVIEAESAPPTPPLPTYAGGDVLVELQTFWERNAEVLRNLEDKSAYRGLKTVLTSLEQGKPVPFKSLFKLSAEEEAALKTTKLGLEQGYEDTDAMGLVIKALERAWGQEA